MTVISWLQIGAMFGGVAQVLNHVMPGLPMEAWVFGLLVLSLALLLGFALMFARSIQIAVENWRRGYSILERPGAFDGTEG